MEFEKKAINTIRFLAVDMINKAKSGHPGVPTGCATIAYTLFTKQMKFNPKNPNWFNRDRFVLSNGHGSSLLYVMNYLLGYDITLDDLKQFRQLNSLTPGHPEYKHTPGVELTTGPLGAGLATAVGFALAEKHLAATFNKENKNIVDHYTYVLCGDGCLMEGVTSEACSLAGTLKLNKLIVLYDDNNITIDGNTSLAFTEDVAMRYKSYGWNVIIVKDGNNVEEINNAIEEAKKSSQPSIIVCKTIIGYGLPNKQGKSSAHGEPPGADETKLAKEKAGYPLEEFYLDEEVLKYYRQSIKKGEEEEGKWNELLNKYIEEYNVEGKEFKRRLQYELPEDFDKLFNEEIAMNEKGEATRISGGKALNEIAKVLPEIVGGTADVGPSVKAVINGSPSMEADPKGRNIHFGIREHAMGNIVNGMAIHGGLYAFGSCFFVFADYFRPTIRLAALSKYPSIFILTHDSIGVGEDGPTHQPIEHLMSFRAMPNCIVLRPSDANETNQAYKYAIKNRESPVLIILARQNTKIIDRNEYASSKNLVKGAYVLKDLIVNKDKPLDLILMATGTEVDIIIEAANKLSKENGKNVRIVSMPSWELFEKQSEEYKKSVFPEEIKNRISVEAGATFGWERYTGDKGIRIGMTTFGASAPMKQVYEKFGITSQAVISAALSF